MEDWHLSTEERNYARDRRVTATFIPEPPKGVAFHWVVCDLCRGHGKVVNPSIDASGLTREDFDEDPDFADDYRSGQYDITCPRCRGRSTIPVIDATGPSYDDDGNAICSEPGGHSWVVSDEDDRSYCEYCSADGDA